MARKFQICLGPIDSKDVGAVLDLVDGIAPLLNVSPIKDDKPQRRARSTGSGATIGKGIPLTETEKARIIELREADKSIPEIAKLTQRSRASVRRVLGLDA